MSYRHYPTDAPRNDEGDPVPCRKVMWCLPRTRPARRRQAERALVEYGNPELVLQTRHEFQNAMRDDLIAIIERETGRKVVAFMSDNHIDPDIAAEVFALEPVSA